MASKNSTKAYVENGYYHIYNRGVEKRAIFLDQQDYGVFLSYLKEYLLPKNEPELYRRLASPDITSKERAKILRTLRLNNFDTEVVLLAYCLMPNHFHFFIKQKNSGTIDKFMNSLGTRYSSYFNRKYSRVGSLFQGVYKAVLIEKEEYYLHLSRYIHRQALEIGHDQPSSLREYLGSRTATWINTEEVLSRFAGNAIAFNNFTREDTAPEELMKLKLDD